MGFMDKLKGNSEEWKDKAADAVDQHADRADQGIERGGDFVSEKTGGRYDEHIDSGSDKVREGLDSLDGEQDDFPRRQAEGQQ